MTRHDLAVTVTAAYTAGMTALLALTRNGRHLIYVTAVALHRLLVPETGQRGLNEPAGVRDALRDIALSTWWQAHNLAGQPRLWRAERRIVRGCVTTPLLASPGDLPAEVRHDAGQEVPVPASSSPGRALPDGEHPYPMTRTAPQPALREQLEPLSPARPFVLAEPRLPEVIP